MYGFPKLNTKESPCFCQLIPSNNYSNVTELPGAFVLSPNNLLSVDCHEILLISKREVQIILQRTWRPSRLWCHRELHQNRAILLNTRTLAKSHLSKIKLKLSENFCNTSLCMKIRLWRLSCKLFDQFSQEPILETAGDDKLSQVSAQM
jgi:hypothetical protein